MLDEYLSHYDLGGSENRDVIEGINKLVVPLIQKARALLKDNAQRLKVAPSPEQDRRRERRDRAPAP